MSQSRKGYLRTRLNPMLRKKRSRSEKKVKKWKLSNKGSRSKKKLKTR
jgi:hypothetical protein